MCSTWRATVCGLITSFSAIWRLSGPRQMRQHLLFAAPTALGCFPRGWVLQPARPTASARCSTSGAAPSRAKVSGALSNSIVALVRSPSAAQPGRAATAVFAASYGMCSIRHVRAAARNSARAAARHRRRAAPTRWHERPSPPGRATSTGWRPPDNARRRHWLPRNHHGPADLDRADSSAGRPLGLLRSCSARWIVASGGASPRAS